METKNKTMMKFITLEDREGLCEAVLFAENCKKYGHLLKSHGPYVVKGRAQSRLLPTNRGLRFASTGEANLLVDEVEALPLEKGK
ncbi:OB-fold nucleic acid binding domain-containing protein [Calditrichota bacterium GD2]